MSDRLEHKIRSTRSSSWRQASLVAVVPIVAFSLAAICLGSDDSNLSETQSSPSGVSDPYNRGPSVSLTFPFEDNTRKSENVPEPASAYPWHDHILTTFWISEPTNHASGWGQGWIRDNGDSDTSDAVRRAPLTNPYYVALPFNDVIVPEKAKKWMPQSWQTGTNDPGQKSVCKDRWVELKNGDEVCYAQWEDVGPVRDDYAEYVFGSERPTGKQPGLSISRAVAKYLNIEQNNQFFSWRFVDAGEVRPGLWVKAEEQAVIYRALHTER